MANLLLCKTCEEKREIIIIKNKREIIKTTNDLTFTTSVLLITIVLKKQFRTTELKREPVKGGQNWGDTILSWTK